MPPTTTVGRKSSGRATAPKAKPEQKPKEPVAFELTLNGQGPYVLRRTWTPRVADMCRRRMGMPPLSIIKEFAEAPDVDTAVRGFCLAAWQSGAFDVDFDAFLDVDELDLVQRPIFEEDDVDSPEV